MYILKARYAETTLEICGSYGSLWEVWYLLTKMFEERGNPRNEFRIIEIRDSQGCLMDPMKGNNPIPKER